jgi:hypothetical protein
MIRPAATVALALLLTLAGCSVGFDGRTAPTPSPQPDRIGWEGGYAANATLNVTLADGISDAERRAVLARTIARVELIRGVEFDGDVRVELLSRDEYRERGLSFTPRETRASDQRWEAAFLVGEDTDSQRAVDALFGGAVAGYYLSSEDTVGLVGGLDTRTLVHELVHALQDQRSWRVGNRATLDGRLAGRGLTEGEAVVVERIYAARCGTEWRCLPRPTREGGNASAVATYPGIYLTFRAPYVAGAAFVEAIRARENGGWSAVTAAYEAPPTTTRELLEPSRYPVAPAPLAVADRSNASWEPYGPTDSLGRVGVHTAFWANRLVGRGNDAVATDYRDLYSQGLVTDRFRAYRDGDADGYVWRLRFTNASEANEFVRGYDRLLRVRHAGQRVADDVVVVRDGPFADAFRVTQSGDTVTVVNAPTVADLGGVHARASLCDRQPTGEVTV